jgi:hypothetical protein
VIGREVLALAEADSVTSLSMTGAEIRSVLEHAAGDLVQDLDNRPLFHPTSDELGIDQFQGLAYELDATRPIGQRVLHLAFRGESLSMERKLRVAVGGKRAARGDLKPVQGVPIPLWETLAAAVRRATFPKTFTPSWTILPDYGAAIEGATIQRLVSHGDLSREESLRIYPDDKAQRGDLAYWLARAFGWHEQRLSGAWSDLPDSLEGWVDGLAKRHVLDTETRTSELFQPYAALTLPTALGWCSAAARVAYKKAPADSILKRLLLAGTSLEHKRLTATDTLTRAQTLGMVANARFLTRK